MRDNRKLITLLWTVIAALVIGGAIAFFMIVSKADELNRTNEELTENNESLRRQLLEARESAGSPSPSPSASATPTPTPTPAATATPTPSPSPTTSPR
ncbi:MAG: hypothetical protein K0S68_785 [Candidatus Saccharibacteria bacterium]|jgi:flagellar basal body-associated protein FliL|nr:hypothetical protein [Candidatus Saccharibacteria bacterium]